MTFNDDKPSWFEVFFADAETLHFYSRTQAIEDGVLVNVTEAAELNGYRHPFAFSHGAYVDAISEHCRGKGCQEVERLHEVLDYIKAAVRLGSEKPSGRVYFVLPCVDGEGVSYLLNLVYQCGPGDNGDPVITVMRPEDD